MKTSLVYFSFFLVVVINENFKFVLNNENIKIVSDSLDIDRNDNLKIENKISKEINSSSDSKQSPDMSENNHLADEEKSDKGILINFI